MTENQNENTETRSFMFYETYRDCMIGLKNMGDYEAATALGWEILTYGFTGKRKNKLGNPIAEGAMRSIAPLIDKSVQNKEEAIEKIKMDEEAYIKNLVVERITADESREY
jgi:hypothetical protein